MKKQYKHIGTGVIISGLLALVGLMNVNAPNKPTHEKPIESKEGISEVVASGKQNKVVHKIPQPTAAVGRANAAPKNIKKQSFKKVNKSDVVTYKQKRYTMLSTPNDPHYTSATYLQTVRAQNAWNVTTGSDDVTVAVLDSGFGLQHEDLVDSYATHGAEIGTTQQGATCWTGTPEDKAGNQCDDDQNGYTDDYTGWNFSGSNNYPQAGMVDSNGEGVSHGTQVAGLVGARGNNGIGSTAITWNVKVLPLQVLSDDGTGYSTDIANAIYYAVDFGVDVINMSLGTSGDDPMVREAVDYAVNHNVVVVAAAGNCGNSRYGVCEGQVSGYVTFPASYNRVLAVGATDNSGVRATFSSYGQRLDIVAPGSGAITTPTWQPTNGVNAYSSNIYGTSFASPITASAAALIRSIRPNSSVDDVRALLMGDARKMSAMSSSFYTQYYGHGMLDVAKTIDTAASLNGTAGHTPTLLQAGTNLSEHSFNTGDTIGSGCELSAQKYCTIWLKSVADNNERYLPYQKTSSAGSTGWTWPAAAMEAGEWQVRARSGDAVSDTPYVFFKK